jgi:hypothetical protein
MQTSLKERIVGTWKLLSWVYSNDKNETVHYFGDDVYGILMYDRSGNMNAQLTRANREKFASNSIDVGTTTEIEKAFKSYLSYFGKYYEKVPGEIVHVVEGSLFPNWIGQEQLRYGRIEDNHLYLSTPPIAVSGTTVQFHLKWQRLE